MKGYSSVTKVYHHNPEMNEAYVELYKEEMELELEYIKLHYDDECSKCIKRINEKYNLQ